MKFEENVRTLFIAISMLSMFLFIAIISKFIYAEFTSSPENIAERVAFIVSISPGILCFGISIIVCFKFKMKKSNNRNEKKSK